MGTVTKAQVMPLVLAALPSYAETWEHEQFDSIDDETGERLLYLDAGNVARYLVSIYANGNTQEVADLFDVIEQLHIEGDDYVSELATIGFVEGIQGTVDQHPSVERDDLLPFLGPVTRQWWDAVDRFWSGEATSVHLPRRLGDSD